MSEPISDRRVLKRLVREQMDREEWLVWCARVKDRRRPIPASATPRNRARWIELQSRGWIPQHRSGTGSWIHPNLPGVFASTAAALLHGDLNEQ